MVPGSQKWTWKDADEIALDLVERHPGIDPLTVSFPELKQLVLELPTFEDEPDAATDAVLESIQAAWYEEFED